MSFELTEMLSEFGVIAKIEGFLRENGFERMAICTDPYETGDHFQNRINEEGAKLGLDVVVCSGPSGVTLVVIRERLDS